MFDRSFRAGVGGAFANYYQGGLGGFEELCDLEDCGFFCAGCWAVRDWIEDLNIVCIFYGALYYIRWKIYEASPWSTVP